MPSNKQFLPILFMPNKQVTGNNPRDLPTAWRTLERWANMIALDRGIQEITSVDSSVTITNPYGPVTDLHAAGGGGLYASLTGPGQTVTPGNLTQAGGFTINDTLASGIYLSSSNRFTSDVYGTSPQYIRLSTGYPSASRPSATDGITIVDQAATDPFHGGVTLSTLHGAANIGGLSCNVASSDLGGATSMPSGTDTHPVIIYTGRGIGSVTTQGGNGVPIWANHGPPNAVSPSSGGGVIPPVGANLCNFCFDTWNGHIWVSNATTGTWSMLI